MKMLQELEDKAKRIEACIDELKTINENVVRIEELADLITSKPCGVSFSFNVYTEKKKEVEIDMDDSVFGSLFNSMYNPYGRTRSEPRQKDALEIDMDPMFSLAILQIILDKAKSRKEAILVQLNHM